MKTLKKQSLCEIPSRNSIFRTMQLGREVSSPTSCSKQGQLQCQPRMLKVLSCQALRASREGTCPASLASLSALAFPSTQLECLLVQGSPLFLTLPPCSTYKPGSVSWIPSPQAGPGCSGSPWRCPSSGPNKPSSLRRLL